MTEDLRSKFLKRASTREIVELNVGLDEPVFIRPMRKATKSRIESIASKPNKTAKDCSDIRFFTLRDCLCDSDGVDILSAADREAFDQMDESFVEPIFDAAMKASNMTEEDKEELASEKN